MALNQKIRQNPIAFTALQAILPPGPACQEACSPPQRFSPYTVLVEELVTLAPAHEVGAKLGINQIADNQGPVVRRTFQRPGGEVIKPFVRSQNVEQNIRIERGNHRPRMSSMNRSTEE